MKIDNVTGEIVEETEVNSENYQLARREMNALEIVDKWLDLKEAYETAKEQFEMVDKPLRRTLKELFKKYEVHRINGDYIDAIEKNGYFKKGWDEEKLIAFIYKHDGNPEDFKTSKWIDGTLQIKYKG